MQSNLFSSSRTFALVVAGATASLLGCSIGGNPPAGSAAYQAGELGNGSFTFSCDDAVSCLSTSNDARAFPSGVANGSTFRVRYVPSDDTGGLSVVIDDDDTPSSANGTLAVVGDKYLVKDTRGFRAKAAGYGTIVARNAAGALIEFTSIRIGNPAQLAVYEAPAASSGVTVTTSTTVTSLRSVTIPAKGARALRVVAQDPTHQNLGGSFLTSWKSDDETVARVDSSDGGRVTIAGDKPGKTKLRITGLELTTELDVEVQ